SARRPGSRAPHPPLTHPLMSLDDFAPREPNLVEVGLGRRDRSGGVVAGGGGKLDQPVDEGLLAGEDLRLRHAHPEPTDPIDLRELTQLAGALRPLHLEGSRDHDRRIKVAFNGPRRDHLATGLPYVAELDDVTSGRGGAKLLPEL